MSAESRTVVVVGSGAGGASVAVTLAESGVDVVVLEEGSRVDRRAYGGTAPAALAAFYRHRGMTPIIGRAPVGFVEGCCIGGSTEINSGFWHRAPPQVLSTWAAERALEGIGADDLAPPYEWAEEACEVAVWSRALPSSTEALVRGATALGHRPEIVARAAARCVGTNTCAQGCPTGAKRGMSASLLPRAEALGARVLSDSRVARIVLDGRRAVAVEVRRDGAGAGACIERIAAGAVFVCGGALQTPVLLQASGLRRGIGNSLGIHPMLRVVARFPARIDAHSSVLPLAQVRDLDPDIVLGGAYLSPGHLAVMLADNWRENRAWMSSIGHLAAYYAGVMPKGWGSVRPDRLDRTRARARYDLDDDDLARLRAGFLRLCEILFAAGAVALRPCVHGVGELRDAGEARRWVSHDAPVSAMSLTTVHAFGSCPMDGRPGRGALDGDGRVHGLDNVHVADASALPGSPGVNPQATIMAVARRCAIRYVERIG